MVLLSTSIVIVIIIVVVVVGRKGGGPFFLSFSLSSRQHVCHEVLPDELVSDNLQVLPHAQH